MPQQKYIITWIWIFWVNGNFEIFKSYWFVFTGAFLVCLRIFFSDVSLKRYSKPWQLYKHFLAAEVKRFRAAWRPCDIAQHILHALSIKNIFQTDWAIKADRQCSVVRRWLVGRSPVQENAAQLSCKARGLAISGGTAKTVLHMTTQVCHSRRPGKQSPRQRRCHHLWESWTDQTSISRPTNAQSPCHRCCCGGRDVPLAPQGLTDVTYLLSSLWWQSAMWCSSLCVCVCDRNQCKDINVWCVEPVSSSALHWLVWLCPLFCD